MCVMMRRHTDTRALPPSSAESKGTKPLRPHRKLQAFSRAKGLAFKVCHLWLSRVEGLSTCNAIPLSPRGEGDL